MKSYNHKFIKICSSMKVSLSIIYALIIILFHLQMMSILYFIYSTVCSPTRSSVSTIQYSNAYHSIIITIFIIIRMYLLTTVITMLMIPMQQALSLPCSDAYA